MRKTQMFVQSWGHGAYHRLPGRGETCEEIQYVMATGYVFDAPDGYALFVHDTGRGWRVIDTQTGIMLTHGDRRGSAVAKVTNESQARFKLVRNEGWYKLYASAYGEFKRSGGFPVFAGQGKSLRLVGWRPRGASDVEWLGQEPKSQSDPEPSVDPEPVEVAEEVPVEAYADVDAGPEPEHERKPHAETRPERFRREYGGAYEMLCDHDGDATVAALERSLVLAGEAFMREHPRMLRKFVKWRGDAFSSDREVAALGMVALAWMDAGRQDRAAA